MRQWVKVGSLVSIAEQDVRSQRFHSTAAPELFMLEWYSRHNSSQPIKTYYTVNGVEFEDLEHAIAAVAATVNHQA